MARAVWKGPFVEESLIKKVDKQIIVFLAQIEQELLWGFSVRDLILIAGGGFLIYKAVREIHHTVELKDEIGALDRTIHTTMSSAITQIILLDVVFSFTTFSKNIAPCSAAVHAPRVCLIG